MKRTLVHNWCPDLASDHRPTWWAEQREDCPDCDQAPSGGVLVAVAAIALPYLLLLAALVAWGATATCSEAVPPAALSEASIGTQQDIVPAFLGRRRHGKLL